MFKFGMISTMSKATRDAMKAAIAIDHIVTNLWESLNLRQELSRPTSGVLHEPLHSLMHWK